LWEQSGRLDGNHEENWFRAETELLNLRRSL
jgi:hypothetical protein